MTLVVLVGGARAGKSALAADLARRWEGQVAYVATAEPVVRRCAPGSSGTAPSGPADWTTVEEPLRLREALAGLDDGALAVVDCLTLWVANLLERGDFEEDPRGGRRRGGGCARAAPVVVVTNEVGLGIVPATTADVRIRDLLGRVNSTFVEHADRAALVVAGRLLPLDPPAALGDGHGRRAEPDDRRIAPLDEAAMQAAEQELDRKTKPRGSLGRLERLAAQYAGIRGDAAPPPLVPAVLVAAADHGYAEDGVSAYQRGDRADGEDVRGGRRRDLRARARAAPGSSSSMPASARRSTPPPCAAFASAAVPPTRPGGPAMSRDQALRAISAGIELARELAADGVTAVALGDMGIRNTTAASALHASLLGVEPVRVCRPGTGLAAEGSGRRSPWSSVRSQQTH